MSTLRPRSSICWVEAATVLLRNLDLRLICEKEVTAVLNLGRLRCSYTYGEA